MPAFLWHEVKTHEFERNGPFGSALSVFVFFVFILPAFTAPFGATILGWIAISQIRRSAGKLHGLWLAVFDGLLFPLLTLDGLIYIAVGLGLWFAGLGWKRTSTPTIPLSVLLFVAVLLGIFLLVDWLIVRAVWRAVNKPAGASVQPVQKPDRFWRWFAVAVFAMIAIPFLISIFGLLAAIAIPNFVKARAQAQENARRAAAQMTTNELPDQNFSFGPVVERTLLAGRDQDSQLLCLDDGAFEIMPAKEGTNSVTDLAEWWRGTKADLAIAVIGQRIMLSSIEVGGAKFAEFPSSRWETASPADVTEALQKGSLHQPIVSGFDEVVLPESVALPATFAVESRTGKIGLLQITGFTENPRGVKIRYKLVQSGDGNSISPPPNSASQLSEPPKLRFLEWDSDWLKHRSDGVHYPDGSIVTNEQELGWLRYADPGSMSDASGRPNLAKLHPHFLHLWFSHPLFDGSCFTEVTLADENGGNPTDPYSSRVGQMEAASLGNGNIQWLIEGIMCGAGTNIPNRVNVRLRYTVGPLEQVQEIAPDFSGSMGLFGDSQLGSIGQDAKGNAFLTIGINPQTMKTRRYCVVAVTRDGRKLISGGNISAFSDDTIPQVGRFGFNIPLSGVAKYRIGTRPIRTMEWTNVVLPSN